MTGESLSLAIPGVYANTSLPLPAGLSFEEWSEIGRRLQKGATGIMWWLGDWWAYGEHAYGERAAQSLESEYAFQTFRDAGWVSRRVDTSRRRDVLSWSHHKEVAALEPEEQDRLLEEAEADGWTRNDIRQAVRRLKAEKQCIGTGQIETATAADLSSLVNKGLRFATIYADPPWLYSNQGTRAATSNHYDGLSVEELCALPVRDLAADNAFLHLWTTNAFLFTCPQIMEAWGFEYRSVFVWAKPQMGIGNYWRVSHEFLVLGRRGDAKWANPGLMSWGQFDRTKHSAKPEQVRQMIESAHHGPYLELFGRRPAPGWVVWGDQIERNMFEQAIENV